MTNSHLLFGRMVGYGGIPQYPQVDLCHMLDIKRPDLTSDRFPIQGRSPLEGRHCCMTSVDSDSNSTSLLQKWWVSQKKLGFLLSFRKSLPYDPTVLLLEKKSPQRCSPRLFLSWGEKLPIPKRCICNRWTWLMTVTLKPGVFSCFFNLCQGPLWCRSLQWTSLGLAHLRWVGSEDVGELREVVEVRSEDPKVPRFAMKWFRFEYCSCIYLHDVGKDQGLYYSVMNPHGVPLAL